MWIVVAGSRTFNNYSLIKKKLDFFLQKLENITIVSGGARGVDKLAERYAKENNYPLEVFKADWKKYGKSAGYKRNVEMAEVSDCLVAFWNGTSPGTKHMIDIAKEKNLNIRIVNV